MNLNQSYGNKICTKRNKNKKKGIKNAINPMLWPVVYVPIAVRARQPNFVLALAATKRINSRVSPKPKNLPHQTV
jgi:hypothetical protein